MTKVACKAWKLCEVSTKGRVLLKCNREVTVYVDIKAAAVCGDGGASLYGLYRYVRPQRVWFFSCFGHKQGISFS